MLAGDVASMKIPHRPILCDKEGSLKVTIAYTPEEEKDVAALVAMLQASCRWAKVKSTKNEKNGFRHTYLATKKPAHSE